MAGSSGANTSSGTAQEGMEQDVVNIASPSTKAGSASPQPPSTTNPVQEATNDVNGDNKAFEVLENGHSENGSDAAVDETVDVFPSLPDSQLVQMGLLPFTDQPVSEVLTEQDIENRYTSLSLAFKTDKVTLRHRYDLQHRQRDQAEKNMQAEVFRLKAAVQKLNRLCVDSESADILTQIQSQVHVLQQSTDRVSNSAEMFGSVQQEQRLSKAVEVMLAHVDNLKRVYEKEHSELEETRRVLTENNIVMGDPSETADDVVSRGRHRSFQTLMATNKIVSQPGAKRRASIATLPRSSGSSDSIRSSTSSLYLADIKSRFGSSNLRRRPSLNPSQPPPVSETPPTHWDSADRLDKTDLNGMDEIEELSESRRESSTSAHETNCSSSPAEDSGRDFTSTASTIITNSNGIPVNSPQEFQDLDHFSLDSEHENEDEEEEEKDHRVAPAVQTVYHPLDCVWDCFSLLFNWLSDLLDPYLPLDGSYILHTMRRGVALTLLIAAAWCMCSSLFPLSSAHPWHSENACPSPALSGSSATNYPT